MGRIGKSLLMALVLALAGGMMLAGCPSTGPDDDDDDASGDPTTVEEICSTVFDCFDNNWGWDTEENCQLLWLTDCADETGYLQCTGACVTSDCADFAEEDGTAGCEPDCWSDFCD